jgi:iron complex outermembrane receptor protein
VRTNVTVAALVATCLLATGAVAQEQAPPTPPKPAAPQPIAVHEHVVVTGVADTAPVTVTTDPRLPRQPMPANDGADYLDTVPGFATVRKGGSGADPVFRGMAGSRLSILIDDGAVLGGCSSRMDAPTTYVFPETFDRITIIKGPQTVKHGPPASAGTVLFEQTRTRFDTPSWLGNASLLGGSWGRNDQVADIRAGTSSFYVRGAGSRSAMDDYDDGNGVAVHSQYLRWNTEAAVGWTPDPQTLLEVAVVGSDGRAAYADRTVDGSKFLRLGASSRYERTRPGASLNRLEVTAFYNSVDHVMDNYSLRTFVPTPMAPAPSAMNPARTTTGARLATQWLGGKTTWDAGADVLVNAHSTRMSMRQDTVPVDSLPRMDDARFSSVGAFLETSHQWRPNTLVVAGGRVDLGHGTDLRNTVALGMMAQVPNPTAQQRRDDVLPSAFARIEQRLGGLPLTAFAGVGHVRRFPDYWELMTRESVDSVSAFGTRPEATTQVDTGFQVRHQGTSAYVAVFANRIDDFILLQSGYTKPTMMGTRSTVVVRNVEAGTVGTEAGVSQRVGRLSADASVAWVRGANETDDLPLAQTPPVDGRLTLAWNADRWSAGGLLRAVASQDRVAIGQGTIVGQDITTTPGFTVLSLNGAWRLASIGTIAVGVDNVLDRAYAEHISRQGASVPGFALQTAQVPEPGRTWWIRLNVRH